jgi:glycine cleavage system transcriptional repressor
MPEQLNYLVISALGQDHPGIVNRLAGAISEHDCNIVDSRMAVLGGEFAAMLLVEGRWNTLAKIERALPALEKALDMKILAKRTEGNPASRQLLPYLVEVVAMDHPGIVHQLADFFASRAINIQDLSTHTYAAPHTGTPMFAVHMSIGIPNQLHIGTLREEFVDYCDALNLDAILEPIKG